MAPIAHHYIMTHIDLMECVCLCVSIKRFESPFGPHKNHIVSRRKAKFIRMYAYVNDRVKEQVEYIVSMHLMGASLQNNFTVVGLFWCYHFFFLSLVFSHFSFSNVRQSLHYE